MKVAVLDSNIGLVVDINTKNMYYYVVEDIYDFSGNSATDVTSVESLSLLLDSKRISYRGFRESLKSYVALVGFSSLSSQDKNTVSYHYVISKADRDSVHSVSEQEKNLKTNLSRMWFDESQFYIDAKAQELRDGTPEDVDELKDSMILELSSDPYVTTFDNETTISLNGWQERVSHTIITTGGKFKISWYAELKGSIANKKIEARVIINDTDVIAGILNVPNDGSNYYTFSGKKNVTLNTGAHVVRLEVQREPPTTITIRNSEISTRRVK
jgi:hypothetical protein